MKIEVKQYYPPRIYTEREQQLRDKIFKHLKNSPNKPLPVTVWEFCEIGAASFPEMLSKWRELKYQW